MSSVPQAGSSARRAALMAHALPKDDQAWLLGALPASRRLVLEGLLAELHEVGIPPDAALLDALEAKDVPAPPASAVEALAVLLPRQVRVLAQVLQKEDAAVAARLLGCRPWAWRDALLAAMDPAFAEQVRGAVPRSAARALDAALCQAVLQEVQAASQATRDFARGAFLQRLGRVLRAPGGQP